MNCLFWKTRGVLRRCLCAVMMAVLMVVGGGVCCTAEEAKTEAKTVRVVFPVQDGVSEIDENGNYSGYSYEYLQRIAQFTGWQYEFITFPDMNINEAITEAMTMVQRGEADLMGCMLKLDGTTEQFEYPEQSYGAVYTTLSVLESNADITEMNYMLVSPLRIAVLEQSTTRRAELADYFDRIGATYEEVLCQSAEEQTQALLTGKADALLRISLSFVRGTRQIAQFAPRPYYFVTTKGNTAIADQLDKAIRLVHENYPSFQSSLFQKYFGDSSGGFLLTDEDRAYIQQHATIRALYMTNNAPYSWQRDGEPTGILVSILDDFATAIGAQVAYTPLDSLDELQATDAAPYDCVLGTLFCTDASAQLDMATTNTIFTTGVEQFFKRGSPAKPLAESVVALHRGCGLQDALLGAKEIRWYDSLSACVEAVNRGDCDTGFADNYSLRYILDKENYACSTTPFYGKTENVQAYMLNTGDWHDLSIFNRYIDNLTDAQIYAYIEGSTRVSDHQGFLHILRSNPVAAAAWLLLMLVLVLFCVIMAVFMGQLKSANTQLRIANSAKSSFLSRVSHDMRTPLNGILGLLILMRDRPEAQPLKTELDQMEMSGKYLLALINDTLDVEKIEQGHMELHPVVYNAGEITENILTLLQPELERKHLHLSLRKPDTADCMLYVDVGRFEQVFMNIIGNSVKFTPEGGAIDVTVDTLARDASAITERFVIRDHGIGMSEAFLPHLFEPFSQENSATTSIYKGTGLGMTICKQIIELMQGEIHVASTPGEGTEFTFTLRLPLATEEQITAAHTEGKKLSLDVLRGKRVLLLEDHPLNAQIAQRLLEKKGLMVDHAENGAVGLDIFKQHEGRYYDVILMDIRMPVMDGLEATRAIRDLGGWGKDVPIIAMTANALDEDVRHCMTAGMTAHLSKPIDPEKMYETIAEQLKP